MKQDYFIERFLQFFASHPILTKWIKRLGKLSVILIFVGIITGFSLLKYSQKPEFCKSCHYMQPFYDAWETSSHNRVACIECHYAPGIKEEVRSKWEALSQVAKYITGTYGTKPWAEISDRSCLRPGCHDKRLLRGKVVFENVLFDHSAHLTELRRGKRLRCTSCHSQIVQGEHMTVTTTTCILCHFKGQEEGRGMTRCTLCHTPPSKAISFGGVTFNHADAVRMGIACTKCHLKVTQGSGNVPRDRCYSCHLEPTRIAKYDDSVLIHDIHITDHKVECTACHLEMEHKITNMSEAVSLDCNSCHPGHHAAQKELYMGIGGEGVPHQPDPMFLTRVNCEGCHIAHKGSKVTGFTRTAPSAACMSCHGIKFGKMLEQWEKAIKDLLKTGIQARTLTQKELQRAESEGKNVLRAKKIFEAASYNIDLVDYGRGVHNIRYSQQLIISSLDSMRVVLKLVGSSSEIPEHKGIREMAKNNCYQCHFGMFDVASRKEKAFSHDKHVIEKKISCLSCHLDNANPEDSVHGRLSGEGRQCSSCHHKPGGACEQCHPLQKKVYDGTIEYAGERLPDLMAQAGVECEGCHVTEAGQVVRPTAQVCVTCHDESYADLVAEWQGEIKSKLDLVRGELASIKKAMKINPDRFKDLDLARYEKLFSYANDDGSFGIHNYQLTDDILSQAEEALKARLQESSGGK